MRENSIPEILETEEDKNRSFKDLREFYINYAKINFQGKKYRNKAMDEEILVSRDGLDKLESMSGSREQCIAVQLLDKFLINSNPLSQEKDRQSRPSVIGFIKLEYQCKVNDKPYKVYTFIKRILDHPLKFYGYVLLDIKIEATRW